MVEVIGMLTYCAEKLIQFCNTNLKTNIHPVYDEIEVGNLSIFQYPWVHLTGHGNVVLAIWKQTI